MDKTLLVFGDMSDWDSFKKFQRNLLRTDSKKFKFIISTYKDFEDGKLPRVESSTVIVYLFFPFEYWNKNIEYKDHNGLYGNVEFYEKFRAFWTEIYRQLSNCYQDKNLYFINHPLKVFISRDKEVTKSILREKNIQVPTPVFLRNMDELLKLVNEENKRLFLKVRYGSMGKGITYLEKGKWLSNFRYENGKIRGPFSDYGWTFAEFTNNYDFLRELLTKDIIIEEAVDSYIIGGCKFDLRCYVCFDKVLYIYPRTNDSSAPTTNISQGGKGRNRHFLFKFPNALIEKVTRCARRATKALGLSFAGIDIMIGKNLKDVYVIEVNTFPGFPGSRRFNLSKRIIKEIEMQKWTNRKF